MEMRLGIVLLLIGNWMLVGAVVYQTRQTKLAHRQLLSREHVAA
jgi:hypothetical protein